MTKLNKKRIKFRNPIFICLGCLGQVRRFVSNVGTVKPFLHFVSVPALITLRYVENSSKSQNCYARQEILPFVSRNPRFKQHVVQNTSLEVHSHERGGIFRRSRATNSHHRIFLFVWQTVAHHFPTRALWHQHWLAYLRHSQKWVLAIVLRKTKITPNHIHLTTSV